LYRPPHENLTRAEAQARAELVRDLDYAIELDLTQGEEQFGAQTTVTFASDRPGATTFIDCTAVTVERIEFNGQELDLDRVSPTRIALPPLAGDNRLTIVSTMAYRHEGKGLHRFVDPSDGGVYLHSQFQPFDAHLVFPCFDQPDLKERSRSPSTRPPDGSWSPTNVASRTRTATSRGAGALPVRP
jgi:aminopeptidase N